MAPEREKEVSKKEQVLEEGSLLEEIVQATKLKPTDESYSLAKKGIEAFIALPLQDLQRDRARLKSELDRIGEQVR